ncbi:PEF-CTERM sorting domain-containing protein [Methanolobus sp. WCC5]|uniref:PEF-CTERM sorting domain-containing protein n=1 Tax=Methanolobus sp. WCC5 TaxID=3125785 RepID=UPI003251809E
MKHVRKLLIPVVMILICLAATGTALGASYRGVEFPAGAVCFADEVADYQLNGGAASGDISRILGIPDGKYVSLGDKGYIVVKFTDNALTTSGDSQYDLAVFEAGSSAREQVEVFISTDGQNWIKIGDANKKTLFDIDPIEGVIQGEKYSYVKLTDLTGLSKGTSYEGADMDAVGAITSTDPAPEDERAEEENEENEKAERTIPESNEIPEFPTIAIPMLAILGLAFIYGRRKE